VRNSHASVITDAVKTHSMAANWTLEPDMP